MSIDITNTIEKTKAYLRNTFFKISANGELYIIDSYKGPAVSINEMMEMGYNRHPELIDYINEDYPSFILSDFYSIDGIIITKKTTDDVLRERIQTAADYFTMNQDLVNAIQLFRNLVIDVIGVTYSSISFTEYTSSFNTTVNGSSMDELSKIKMIITYDHLINEIYTQLEICGIDKPRKFFNDKFNDFLILLN